MRRLRCHGSWKRPFPHPQQPHYPGELLIFEPLLQTEAEIPAELLDHTWVLTAAGDEAADMFLPDPPAWLRFTDDPDPNDNPGFSFEGFSGCNTLFGSYQVTAGTLVMNVGMTQQGCEADLMAFEQLMVDTLRGQPAYNILAENGDTFLTLQIPDQAASRLVFRAETAVSSCTRPDDLPDKEVDVTPDFCIVWLDEFDDETGFEIRLFYPRSEETFIYSIDPNITEFTVPDADAPHLDRSLADCDRRKDFDITVTAHRPTTDRTVGSVAAIIECHELFAPSTPDAAARLLQNSFAWEEIAPNLHVLTGWEEGFRGSFECDDGPYRWLDDTHLMLLPVVAYTTWFENDKGGQLTQPVILDITTGAVWVSDQVRTDGCQLPVYSPALQLLAESNGGTVWLRQLDGYFRQSYAGGNPLHMGETGLRLLAGDTWIDLTTGDSVVLPIDEPFRLRKVAWTEHDTRFYACCLYYGDAQAGTFYRRDSFDDIFPGGTGVGPGYSGEFTQWFGDGQVAMHEAGAVYWTRMDGADVATLDRPPVTPTLPVIDPVQGV